MRRAVIASVLVACSTATVQPSPTPNLQPSPAASAQPARPIVLTVRGVPLPSAQGPVSLDYIAFERATDRLWIPAGDTGSVDVFDAVSEKMSRVAGFAVAERGTGEHLRKVGPSSAAIGDGVVYVGNRATSEVCAIDATTLQRGACTTLASSPDGLQYVSTTKELWITTPKDRSITVLDAALKPRSTIPLAGSPEGYAFDQAHGFFFTNLEDGNRTLKIDIDSHKVVEWKADCGEAGPRGIAVDTARNFAFVACTDHVVVVDTSREGALLFRADTGAGVDNIDYVASRHELFVASGKDARLTVFRVDDQGALQTTATAVTAPGARTVVADAHGNAYVIDPKEGKILVVSAAP